MLKIGFSKPEPANTGTLVVGILEDRKLTPAAQALDKKTGGVVTRAMTASRRSRSSHASQKGQWCALIP